MDIYENGQKWLISQYEYQESMIRFEVPELTLWGKIKKYFKEIV